MNLLEASGVTVRYGGVVAVSGVDLVVRAGTVHGVIGPNGAGKSTFIDALSGRRRPSAGRVALDGLDITGRSPAWRRRHGVSRSFQRSSVFPAMTVQAQLELVARRTAADDLDELVDMFGLESLLGRRCDSTSYGDQRTVDVAMALIGRPRVALLDEPAAGLTREQSEGLMKHIRRLATSRGMGTLLVDHDVDAVFGVCDEVTVLHLGRVLASGPAAEVRKDRRVIEAYLGSAA